MCKIILAWLFWNFGAFCFGCSKPYWLYLYKININYYNNNSLYIEVKMKNNDINDNINGLFAERRIMMIKWYFCNNIDQI